MTLESQVVSLELAKKLKELGVKQESLFYWRENYHTESHINEDNEMIQSGIFDGGFRIEYYPKPRYSTADLKWNQSDLQRLSYTELSAFTVAELGEMLPTYNPSYRLTRHTTNQNVFVCENNSNADIAFTADTEADARAKMLIYLLENNLITL